MCRTTTGWVLVALALAGSSVFTISLACAETASAESAEDDSFMVRISDQLHAVSQPAPAAAEQDAAQPPAAAEATSSEDPFADDAAEPTEAPPEAAPGFVQQAPVPVPMPGEEFDDPTDPDGDDEMAPLAVEDVCCYPDVAATRWCVRTDYSMWWLKGNSLPPLVTTSPYGTDREDAGVLGRKGTRILFGEDRVDDAERHGGRINVLRWLDDCQSVAVEFSFMGLASDDTRYRAASLGDPILARPFYNVIRQRQDAELIAFPEVIVGSVDVVTTSELYSAGALLRRPWICGSCAQIDMIGGYRYVRFREGLTVFEDLISKDEQGDVQVDTQIDVYDSFTTTTDFHGGEIGLATEWYHGPFSLSLLTKLAIGRANQAVAINGSTTVTTPGDSPETAPGGLLALRGTNLGKCRKDRFAMLPELDLTLNCRVSHCLRLSAGYSLLYLTEAVRTGDQIDLAVNPTYVPGSPGTPSGPRRPAPRLHSTSMWAQGLNVGAVFEF
jgi:hypothetical protein